MSDGIMLTIGDDGEATLYDDTYDITIHCERKEEQDEARKALEEHTALDTSDGEDTTKT